MTVINEHNFTGGSNGDDVDTLTPTTGGAHSYLSGVRMLKQDDRAYANGATCLYTIPEVPTFPYRMTAVIRALTFVENSFSTLALRGTTGTTSFFIKWNAAGSFMRLGATSEAAALSTGVDYTLVAIMLSGTKVLCYRDGTLLFGGVQTITDRGAPLVQGYRNEDQASSSTTGGHFKSVKLENISAASLLNLGLINSRISGGRIR